MSDQVILPRAVAEQVLEALRLANAALGHPDNYTVMERAMTALRAALAQQAEPVALVENGTLVRSSLPLGYTGPLYTAPPRQEWVSLTDEQIEDLALNGTDSELRRRQFARAIEQTLKEKNHG